MASQGSNGYAVRGFFAPGLAHVLPEQAGEGYGLSAYAAVGVAQGAEKKGSLARCTARLSSG